ETPGLRGLPSGEGEAVTGRVGAEPAWVRGATAAPGRPERWGLGGHLGAPMQLIGRPEPPMRSIQRRLQPLHRLALVLLVRLVREPGVVEEDPLRRGQPRRVGPAGGVAQARAAERLRAVHEGLLDFDA